MSGYFIAGLLWTVGLCVAIWGGYCQRRQKVVELIALASPALVVLWASWAGPVESPDVFAGSGMRQDAFSLFVQIFVLTTAFCALLLGQHLKQRWQPGSSGLILLSAAGAVTLPMAWDLIGLLAGFVATLLPLWGLAAMQGTAWGREGALKGTIAGALGAGLLGLGTALLLVRTGTTQLVGTHGYFASAGWIGQDPMVIGALALLLAGVGCFVAAVPFHMWFVDAVESLPIPGALFLSGGVMAAGLAAVTRMLFLGFLPVAESGPGYVGWIEVVHGVGLVALLVCNALALVQGRLKRMIAYLAAGQAGMALVAIAAAGSVSVADASALDGAVGAVLVFLAVFAVNWIGLFVAVATIDQEEGADPAIVRLRGLAKSHPGLALAIGLSLLCMAGMPFTAGFFSRLVLLETMVEAGWLVTAILAALSLGVVLVMSLGLVAAMVMRPQGEQENTAVSPSLALVAVLCSVAILLEGILPGGLLDLAIRSARALISP